MSERGALRLDAEFVDPETLQLEDKLKIKHCAASLSATGLVDIENYVRPTVQGGASQKYVAIDSIDDQDGFIFHQSVAEEELPGRAKYILEPFDIVVSNVRPERGAIGLVLSAQAGAIGSSGLTVLRVASAETRNVLFAYLRSRSARAQLIRRSRGSMYPAITKDDVPEILVPVLADKARAAVHSAVEASIVFRNSFFELYEKQNISVENYLSQTLGPPPPDIVLEIASELPVRLALRSELFSSGADRFDAEFHRKEFVEFEEHLKTQPGIVRLDSAFEAFAGGNPGKGGDALYRLRQAQLSGFGVSYSGCEELENSKAPTKSTLRQGDVLIGCTAHEPHYVGNRVDLVDDLPPALVNRIVPVPDVMIIRARPDQPGPTPAFVANFLRTKWGRRQFQRLNRGVRGGHVYGQDVEAFIYVPTPPASWMKTFNERQDLIRAARRGSIEAMTKAVNLIETALA